MKRILAAVTALLLLCGIGYTAAGAESAEDTHLTVCSVTPFTGAFATKMFGNAESDINIRVLLHGYDTVEWRANEGAFALDRSVVSGYRSRTTSTGDVVYTLTFYNDLFYNDGSRISAWDYAFSFLLSVAPEIEEIGGKTLLMEYVKGYSDYVNGKTPYFTGIRVLSDDTLEVTIDKAYLPFFYEQGLLSCVPYPIAVIAPGCRVADDGKGVYITNEDPAVKEPLFTADLLRTTLLDPETGYVSHPYLSSGPYKLVSYDGETVEAELNSLYKGNSDGIVPRIQTITARIIDNENIAGALRDGETDLVNKIVSAKVLDEVLPNAQGAGLSATDYLRTGLSFISFCCEKAPLDRAAVRQAVAMCLDKDGLVNDTVGAYGKRVDGYYGLGQWMYRLVNGELEYPVEAVADDAPLKERKEYQEKIAEWESLSMGRIPVYGFDTAAAKALLVKDGWTLNADGGKYTEGVRYAKIDKQLVPLRFTILCPEGSSITEHLQERFVDHLAEIGIEAVIETAPMPELLRSFYRDEERAADMYVLASNFDLVFDPSITFMPDGKDAVNRWNPTGIADRLLYKYAVEMRETEPGNLLDYCKKWIKFQKRFQEICPMIPIYSNVYYDVYANDLQDYDIFSNVTWSQAIVPAWLGSGQEN